MRYMINDAFAVLQIKPTDDKREIKKAYAKLVKQYHPEEHPTEWKNIRDAYETAIAYAERQSDAREKISYKGKMEGTILSGLHEESAEWMPQSASRKEKSEWMPQSASRKEKSEWMPQSASRKEESERMPQSASHKEESEWMPQSASHKEESERMPRSASHKDEWERMPRSASRKEEAERMRPEKLTSEDAFPVKQETLNRKETFEKEENDTHPEVIRKSAFEETETEPENETDELDGVFEQLDELSQGQAKHIHEIQLKQALQKLEQLAKIKDIGQWETFFYETDLSVLATGTFLYKWGDTLSNMKISKPMYELANNQLIRIREYCRQNEIIHEKSGLLSPLEYVRSKLSRAKRKKGFSLPLVVFVCAVLFVLCRPEVWKDDKSEIPTIGSNESIAAYLMEDIERDKENIAALEGTGYTKEGLLKAIETNQLLMSGVYESREMEQNPYVETIEKGIRIKEGIYLSGWEEKLNPFDIQYEEITDAAELGTVREESLAGKDYYAVKIWTDSEKKASAVCFKPETLGFSENCKIYFSYGGGYVEVSEYNLSLTQVLSDFCFFKMEDYYVFSVLVPQGDESKGVTVLIVEG